METKTAPIGELLVSEGLVTQDQIEKALRIQSKLNRKKRLGRILIELGDITEDQLHSCLQKFARPTRFGDLLVGRDHITTEQLEWALACQAQNPQMKLGEVLIHENLMTPAAVCSALAEHLGMDRVIPEIRLVQWSVVDKLAHGFMMQNRVCPYRKLDQTVQILVSEKHRRNSMETLQALYGSISLALVTEDELSRVLQYVKEKPDTNGLRVLGAHDDDDTVAGFVDAQFSKAIEMGASDIHIEPQDSMTRIRFRIDGTLIEIGTFPKRDHLRFVSRVKVLAGSDITERRNHQDGKIQISYHGHCVDLRVSVFVTIHGESLVIRLLNPLTNLLPLDQLGFNALNYRRYCDEVVPAASGIVLYTGPTGCGKTTSLYSTLQVQRSSGLKIVSVEDPVEYVFPELTQCSVDAKSGRTFSSSLKHIMRQDPDVIVLGEIRDRETAEISIHASLTGHKVYSTFHTEDATGAMIRLVQMGIEPYLVASTVLAVAGQRLLRRICLHCKQPYVPHTKHLRRLGISPGLLKNREFFRGRGCEKCHHSGYSGRVAVHELLILEEHVRDAVIRNASSFKIRDLSIQYADMITIVEDAVIKVFDNLTTFEEAVHKIPIKTPSRPYAQITDLVR